VPQVTNNAVVHTNPEQARWIREQQHWSFVSELKHPEGLVVMTYQNFDWHTFINWLCTVNDYIVLIEPEEVRVQLRNKISNLQKLLT
jgi:predicted DNA-binding transcriptional regulator YafY